MFKLKETRMKSTLIDNVYYKIVNINVSYTKIYKYVNANCYFFLY